MAKKAIGDGVRCMECGAGTAQKISINEWNDCRPIEDALTQRVKVLEEALKKIGGGSWHENGSDQCADVPLCCNGAEKIAIEALAPPVGEKDKS